MKTSELLYGFLTLTCINLTVNLTVLKMAGVIDRTWMTVLSPGLLTLIPLFLVVAIELWVEAIKDCQG